MNSPRQCLECGAHLRASDVQGLCPKCLLKLGLLSQFGSGAEPAAASAIFPDGALAEPFDFGRYQVLRLLGKGGMGAVYEAEQRDTGRRVALKVLGHTLDSSEMRQRFIREGQLAASVRHPNVVAVFGAEEIEGVPVIAMEMVADGTLKDRVQKNGPLPVTHAVDAVLQMIDGLEAAHAAGVLHRDIKPANSFVTRDGAVKVGDFGLSISTLAKAETHLTHSGTVLGTPAFASPEQLRGREVDGRSDIYGVGATLYFLLTGRPTHDAESLVSLIASVLEKIPDEPRALRAAIPPALSRVVMRCLAKDPAARFPNYSALRDALLPFSSVAPTAATVGLRFASAVIDWIVVATPGLIYMFATGDRPIDALLIARSMPALLLFAAFFLFELVYFAIPEGLWGASLGKALCGLRVIRMNKQLPGIFRAGARALIVSAPELIGALLAALTMTGLEYDRGISGPVFVWSDWPALFLSAMLVVSMRRRNGFAMLHDLLTGTRVVARPSSTSRSQIAPALLSPSASSQCGPDHVGPYAVIETEGPVILAHDVLLARHVWIRQVPPGTPPVDANRRDLHRPTRLRWLNGERGLETNWDAFEAPRGIPISRLLDKREPWSVVRFWLLDVAEELTVALQDGTLPHEIGVDRFYLTSDGRTVLIEFPTPGSVPSGTCNVRNAKGMQQFLSELAQHALTTRVPLHATQFLEALTNARFEAPAQIAANLRELSGKLAEVTRRRRLFSIAIPALVALVAALVTAFTLGLVAAEFDADWHREHPDLRSLRQVLEIRAREDEVPAQKLAQVDEYLAGNYRAIIGDDAFWGRPRTLAAIDSNMKRLARDATATHRNVSPAALQRAETTLAQEFADQERLDNMHAVWMVPLLFWMFLGCILFCGAVLAPIFRVPLGLHAVGLALVTGNGKRISRLRSALRSLPISIVAATCGVASASLQFMLHWVPGLVAAVAVSAVLLVVGAVWSMVRPERGLPDWIARTFLVAR